MSSIRPFCMPKWGIEMTEGTLSEWMVKEGERFKRGDILCLIETDKITNEVEAEYDAVIRRVLVTAGGDPQPVGTLLAVFGDEATDDSEIDDFIGGFTPAENRVAAKKIEPKTTLVEPVTESATASASPKAIETNRAISPRALEFAEEHQLDISLVEGTGRRDRITHQDVYQSSRPDADPALKGAITVPLNLEAFYASPLAKRLAAIHQVDLARVTGTGPRGRICKSDVLKIVEVAACSSRPGETFVPADNQPVIAPMDKVRKVVARRLTQSKQDIPHFYLRMSVGVDALLEFRKTANLVLGVKASINDYLIRAAAVALSRHPDINIQVHGDSIHRFPHADISIAVASPKGLVTPIVHSADLMRVDQIATVSRRLIDRAQANKLAYEDMDGGTFSISNLGMFGIDQFDAIINPPQGAILAVGGITRQPREAEGDRAVFEDRMALSLSVDHRAIDGAAGASFMKTLRELVETPQGLFQAD